MEQTPPEVLVKVFSKIPSLDLPRLMTTCRDWNTILRSTSSFWRSLDLEDYISLSKAHEMLRMLSIYSNNTMETIKIKWDDNPDEDREGLIPRRMEVLLDCLESSRMSLGNIKIDMRPYELSEMHQDIIGFFRSFPKLRHLNLTSHNFPEAPRFNSTQEGLVSLALAIEHDDDFKGDTLGWISGLQSLLVDFGSKAAEPPTGLLQLVQACESSLIEFAADLSIDENTPQICTLSLSNVRSFRPLDSQSSGGERFLDIQLPSLQHVSGRPENLYALPFKGVESLSMEIYDSDYDRCTSCDPEAPRFEEDERTESLQKLLQPLRANDSSLVRLELSNPPESRVTFPINIILKHLTAKSDRQVSCPSLSELCIDEGQIYDVTVLVEMMFSRRLYCRNKIGNELGCPQLSSEITLYLDSSQIERFQSLEAEVLEKKGAQQAELIGKSKVKRIEEWKGFWVREKEREEGQQCS